MSQLLPVPPTPTALLDSTPPSPEGVPAEKPKSANFAALQPQTQPANNIQVINLVLQTAAAANEAINMLSEMIPNFGATGADINERLRAAITTALEQGLGNPEPRPGAQLLNKLAIR